MAYIFSKKNFLVLGLLLALTSWALAEGQVERTPPEKILVTPQWVKEHKGDLTILDIGRTEEDFLSGHIPGAVQVNRNTVWDQVGDLQGMLPEAEAVAQELGELGVSNTTKVVVYDSGNGLWAARLFWALEILGHPQVHLLNGGIQEWIKNNQPLSTDPVIPQRGNFVADFQEELIADKEYILTNLDSVNVVDTRSAPEFAGTDLRAARGGHIPGALHIEWKENLEGSTFKSLEELRELYSSQSVEQGKEAITLCQTGVRGAHTYVALRSLGYDKVKLYDGSWTDWGNDPTLPIEQ